MTRVRFAAVPLALALALAGPARAGTLFQDPYGVGAPDVIGSLADFDIRSLEVQTLDPSTLSISVRMNYHGGDVALAPFTEPGTSYAGAQLLPGDVLIQGATSLWAIPLSGAAGGPGGGIYYAVGQPVPTGTPLTRGQLLPGSLYNVTGALTAGQVLGVDPASDLRADQLVIGNITSFSPAYYGNIPITSALGGSEIQVQLDVSIGSAFYNDVAGGYRVHFASTTCACDVLDGVYPAPAPEPGAPALLGAAGAWLWLRPRSRRA